MICTVRKTFKHSLKIPFTPSRILVRAYYGKCLGCNLAQMENLYRSGDLPDAALDDFQLIERKVLFVQDILKDFTPTEHIEVFAVFDDGDRIAYDRELIQQILSTQYLFQGEE
jgi:hypothetical protein